VFTKTVHCDPPDPYCQRTPLHHFAAVSAPSFLSSVPSVAYHATFDTLEKLHVSYTCQPKLWGPCCLTGQVDSTCWLVLTKIWLLLGAQLAFLKPVQLGCSCDLVFASMQAQVLPGSLPRTVELYNPHHKAFLLKLIIQ